MFRTILAESIAMQEDDPIPTGEPLPARSVAPAAPPAQPPCEIGGPKGPEPTRFGDWEKAGRCIDF